MAFWLGTLTGAAVLLDASEAQGFAGMPPSSPSAPLAAAKRALPCSPGFILLDGDEDHVLPPLACLDGATSIDPSHQQLAAALLSDDLACAPLQEAGSVTRALPEQPAFGAGAMVPTPGMAATASAPAGVNVDVLAGKDLSRHTDTAMDSSNSAAADHTRPAVTGAAAAADPAAASQLPGTYVCGTSTAPNGHVHEAAPTVPTGHGTTAPAAPQQLFHGCIVRASPAAASWQSGEQGTAPLGTSTPCAPAAAAAATNTGGAAGNPTNAHAAATAAAPQTLLTQQQQQQQQQLQQDGGNSNTLWPSTPAGDRYAAPAACVAPVTPTVTPVFAQAAKRSVPAQQRVPLVAPSDARPHTYDYQQCHYPAGVLERDGAGQLRVQWWQQAQAQPQPQPQPRTQQQQQQQQQFQYQALPHHQQQQQQQQQQRFHAGYAAGSAGGEAVSAATMAAQQGKRYKLDPEVQAQAQSPPSRFCYNPFDSSLTSLASPHHHHHHHSRRHLLQPQQPCSMTTPVKGQERVAPHAHHVPAHTPTLLYPYPSYPAQVHPPKAQGDGGGVRPTDGSSGGGGNGARNAANGNGTTGKPAAAACALNGADACCRLNRLTHGRDPTNGSCGGATTPTTTATTNNGARSGGDGGDSASSFPPGGSGGAALPPPVSTWVRLPPQQRPTGAGVPPRPHTPTNLAAHTPHTANGGAAEAPGLYQTPQVRTYCLPADAAEQYNGGSAGAVNGNGGGSGGNGGGSVGGGGAGDAPAPAMVVTHALATAPPAYATRTAVAGAAAAAAAAAAAGNSGGGGAGAGAVFAPVLVRPAPPSRRERSEPKPTSKKRLLDLQILALQLGRSSMSEKSIRDSLGNTPDVSKALRRLTQEGKVMRTGRGGRSSPFIYHLTDEARQAALVATKAAGIAVQVPKEEQRAAGRTAGSPEASAEE